MTPAGPTGEAGFLALLRRLEREQGHRPRIGRSIRRAVAGQLQPYRLGAQRKYQP